MTIHWCGTGLSAIPGLRRLIDNGHDVTVWNRSADKARAAVGDLTDRIEAFDTAALARTAAKGDVIVSMLPATFHVPLAEIAIAKGAHFVSSSYIAPEMRALDGAARLAGVALVNEVGLDPGIDHVMAHWLMADYRASPAFDPKNTLSFRSYCSGVPAIRSTYLLWSPPAKKIASASATLASTNGSAAARRELSMSVAALASAAGAPHGRAAPSAKM